MSIAISTDEITDIIMINTIIGTERFRFFPLRSIICNVISNTTVPAIPN